VKKLCDHPESPIRDGLCTICSKPVPWHRLSGNASVPTSEISNKIPSESESLDYRLRLASEKVVKISSIFEVLGNVLNIVNYVVAVVILCITFAIGSTVDNGGLVLLGGSILAVLLWGVGWLQVALLRGLSAFFLMRGLSQLRTLK
jgi:hypothetical protein